MTQDELAERLRKHAEILMAIPSGEQWLSHIQTVIANAFTDIAQTIEDRTPIDAHLDLTLSKKEKD